MDTIRIRPAVKGATIPDVTGGALPYAEEGVERERSVHWSRLLAHGDIVDVDAEKAAKAAADKRSAKSKD